ncbi:hypothetical protein ACOMHN_001807 [Nucella lapillus]
MEKVDKAWITKGWIMGILKRLLGLPGPEQRPFIVKTLGESCGLSKGTCDHFCVISQLNVSLPRPQPKYIMACNLKAVNRCALKQDLTTRLSSLTSSALTAAALDSVMTSVLDDHAPATRRKVSARCEPWFSTVAEQARTAKRHKHQMERQ